MRPMSTYSLSDALYQSHLISILEQYPFPPSCYPGYQLLEMERNEINTIVVLVIIIIHSQCYLPLGGAPDGGPNSD